MAYTTITTPTRSVAATLARPFMAFFNLLVAIGAASGQARAVEALNATSDAELAARGITRQQAVMQIFGPRMYL